MRALIAAAASVLLLLAGCASGDPAAPAAPAQESSAPETVAPAPEESTSEEPTEEPSDGDYAVTIDKAKQAKDYDGKPALVVNFTFTNNSDDTANFMFAVHAKAFQDGIELESAIISDNKVYDGADSMKDIKPGKSIKVQNAYLLDGKADVTVEVTELISFDDTLLAEKTFKIK